jgi:hypothetical protein
MFTVFSVNIFQALTPICQYLTEYRIPNTEYFSLRFPFAPLRLCVLFFFLCVLSAILRVLCG